MVIEKKNTADLLPADYNPRKDLKPGDVVFFSIDTEGKAEYVGIYIGGDTFIAARSSQNSVGELYMSSSYWQERYVGARRYF